MTEEALFSAALQKATPAERDAFLDDACGKDTPLRQRLRLLLAAHDRSHGILDDRPDVPGARKEETSSSQNTEPAIAVGTVIAGRYKLLERLGEGGMGTVFVAEQTQPVRRKVALKLIKAGMDSQHVLARFEQERQALALMDHPNIAKVLDGGLTEAGRPFFVMEYIKGEPLTEYCDSARCTVRERLELFVSVCQAVQHAHQKGIIHRDLKPSNILVALYDGRPVIKVIDFGLAKALHQIHQLTERTLHTGHELVLGTPLYMSPEQAEWNNLDIDTRSDIYSLGVNLYELLTGSTPLERQRFKVAGWAEMLRLIREEEAPTPSTRLSRSATLATVAAHRQLEPGKLVRLVRGELDWVVMKALEKDRNRRYETANGIAQDIQRYLAEEPVNAGPPSVLYRLRKFARRHRWQLALVATVLVTLVVTAMGGTYWTFQRAWQQQRDQEGTTHAEKLAWELMQRGRFDEAEAALTGAQDRLGQNETELHQRLRQARANLRLVRALDKVRQDAASIVEGKYDESRAAPAYAAVFEEHKLQIKGVNPGETRHRIAEPIREQVMIALEHWATLEQDKELQRDLLALAQQIDPATEPLRDRLRDPNLWRNPEQVNLLAGDVEVEKLSPSLAVWLGRIVERQGGDGVAILKRAQRTHPADFWTNFALADALAVGRKKKDEEAAGYYRVAIAVRPDAVVAYTNLSVTLYNLNDLEGAIAACRRAIQFNPTMVNAYNTLGAALRRMNLLDAAIASYRTAIQLDPTFAVAHYNLGNTLLANNDLEGAALAYQKAVQLRPNYAKAHGALGDVLKRLGRFRDASSSMQRCLDLIPPQDPLREEGIRNLTLCERMQFVEKKLAAVLEKGDTTHDTAERLELAILCEQPYQQRFASAVRFYSEAFADKPSLATVWREQRRYYAACCAAKAGLGRGRDAAGLSEQERARLRNQALQWLQADLAAISEEFNLKHLNPGGLHKHLTGWLEDPNLAEMHSPEVLRKLPEKEREDWQRFWAQVQALRKRSSLK